MQKNIKGFKVLFFICLFILSFISSGIGDIIIINNANDSGPGSLRDAMTVALDNGGPNTIIFNIPTSDPGYDMSMGIWKIQPLSALPEMITDSTVLDGTTQADFIGFDSNPQGPEIVVDGHQAVEATGFYFLGSHNTIKGIAIHQFSTGLIQIKGDYNKITGCFIGTNATGELRFNNFHTGITIIGSNNIIGGASEADRNIISGNQLNGIFIHNSSTLNSVLGNYIGITANGTDTLGNTTGIRIAKSNYNTIGPGNVISGNLSDALIIQQNSNGNFVIGNFIGTNPGGTIALGNTDDGISITDGASHTIIGGKLPEDKNIISGNNGSGITIHMNGSDYNYVSGNNIGTDISGNNSLPNGGRGVAIANGAKHNTIGGELVEDGNIISGNLGGGILIYNEGTDENIIKNNYIGTAANGTTPLHNSESGVQIHDRSSNNVIGPGNVIAYNKKDGVLVSNNAIGNTITQNSIHSNDKKGISNIGGGNIELPIPLITSIDPVSGTAEPNSVVEFFSSSDDEGKIYEGTTTADGSGNFTFAGSLTGPFITANATDDEGNTSEFSLPRLSGDIIVNSTADVGEGSLRWAIDQANLNPGSDYILFDIPSSDIGFDGTVWTIKPLTNLPVFDDDSTIIDGFSQTVNQGDTNPEGPEILLDGSDNTEGYSIGLRLHSAEHIVSGLTISGFIVSGIEIYFEESHHNWIWGNYIGSNASGSDTLRNGYGISIGGKSMHNIIGGTSVIERNVISGNYHDGISIFSDSNLVIGNYIGTDASGANRLSNDDGVYIGAPSKGNRVGGNLICERNIISGNRRYGIFVSGEGSQNNIMRGNIIGLNAAGDDTLGNQIGICISGDANDNIIGGLETNSSNIISANREDGILIKNAHNNQIIANKIGTDESGLTILPNRYDGITISIGAQHNQIGPENTICHNAGHGIEINGSSTLYNRITQNSIFDNDGKGILLSNGGNESLVSPTFSNENPVQGTAPPSARVEIFSDSQDEGQIYEGFVIADANGFFSWEGIPAGPYITATATDDSGNTSEFSVNLVIGVENAQLLNVPMHFSLNQNYPNPFNYATTIRFGITKRATVRLSIYDITGRLIKTLVHEGREAGYYTVNWNSMDLLGTPVATGVYFGKLEVITQDRILYKQVRKLMLIR